MNKQLIGKEYPSFEYEVGREKIREYACATLADNPIYLDLKFARESKHGTIVAPPTFAAVYCGPAVRMAFDDKELGMKVPRIVHGEQEFYFGKVVKSGDIITTTAKIDNIYQKTNRSGTPNEFLIIKTTSKNQSGEVVCKGVWTLIERGKSKNE